MNKAFLVLSAVLAVTVAQQWCEPSIYDTPQMIPIRKGTTYSAV